MDIVVYGTDTDYNTCIACINAVPTLQYRQIRYTHTDDYDKLIELLGNAPSTPNLILVVADGAKGMEAVLAAKEIIPTLPVIWFSDDECFGAQSYRLGCTFFATKPITDQIIASAIDKYRQERVSLQ